MTYYHPTLPQEAESLTEREVSLIRLYRAASPIAKLQLYAVALAIQDALPANVIELFPK